MTNSCKELNIWIKCHESSAVCSNVVISVVVPAESCDECPVYVRIEVKKSFYILCNFDIRLETHHATGWFMFHVLQFYTASGGLPRPGSQRIWFFKFISEQLFYYYYFNVLI